MEKITVLIVDDEPLVRKVLRSKVDWAFFDMTVVDETVNGEEALEYLNKTPVDLVITDIKMPYMDGNAFINEASKKFPKTRFFVLSAHSDFSIVRNSFKAGAFDYMLKADINTPAMADILKKISCDILTRKQADDDLISVIAINLSKTDFEDLLSVKDRFAETMAIKQEDLIIENGMFLLVNRDMNKDNELVKSQDTDHIKVVEDFLLSKGIDEFDVGISDIGRMADIDKLILNAREACESNFFSESNIQYFRNVILFSSKQNLNTPAMKKSVMEHIKKLEIKGIRSCFDELFKEAYKSNISKHDFVDIILDFYIYVLNHLSDIELLHKDIISDSIEIHVIVSEINRSHKLEKWIFDNILKIEEYYIRNVYHDFVKMVTLYVDLNIEGHISLKQVSKHFNLSGSYLCNKFSKNANITLLEYIARKKADIAKNYLLNTNFLIKEIGTLLGYQNSEHFSRKFKQVVGVSPNDFRGESKDLLRREQF